MTDSRQRLFRFAVVLSGDTVLAGDLVADVLGKVFERWPQVSAADNVHPYVRRMLVNEFVGWQRRRDRPPVLRGPQRRGHRHRPRLPHRHGAQQHRADVPTTPSDWNAYLENIAPGSRAGHAQGKIAVQVLHEDLISSKVSAALLRYLESCPGLHLVKTVGDKP